MRRIQILEQAATEAIEAAHWYETERKGLGHEFSQAVDAALDLTEHDIIPLSPIPGRSNHHGAKRIVLRRFPYDVIAIERAGIVIIVAIAHHSRRPGYWQGRLTS